MDNALHERAEIIEKTIVLARDKRNIGLRETDTDAVTKIGETPPASTARQQAKTALDQHLQSLGMEEIKLLQTILYLGLEYGAETSFSPAEQVVRKYQELNQTGWANKETEIQILTAKEELDIHLKRGLEKAGITSSN